VELFKARKIRVRKAYLHQILPWEELVEGVSLGGVATFLGDAARSRVSLFI
jgi:hypothetical protein